MSNFAYISGDPDNLTGGAAANMVDIQGPFVDLATWLNTDLQPRVAAAVPSFVTSLPVGATDGQEIYYQADAANGIIWHLRYNAGSASAYKWEFVGGSELSSEVITQETTTSSVYVALTTPGPSITLPLAGDYDVTIGTYATVSGAAASAYMSYDIGGSAAADTNALRVDSAVSGWGAEPVRTKRQSGLSAVALVAKYKGSTTNSNIFSTRFMRVRPVRVG